MGKSRKTVELKMKKLIVEKLQNGESVQELAKRYAVGESSIYNWSRKYGQVMVNNETTSEYELIQKDKRIKELESELEILKKALTIFAKLTK